MQKYTVLTRATVETQLVVTAKDVEDAKAKAKLHWDEHYEQDKLFIEGRYVPKSAEFDSAQPME